MSLLSHDTPNNANGSQCPNSYFSRATSQASKTPNEQASAADIAECGPEIISSSPVEREELQIRVEQAPVSEEE